MTGWDGPTLRAAGIPCGAGNPRAMSQRVFTGESLREVAFPLGGIGTGTVSLGGSGDLRDWEIFNRPGKGRNLPYTFFSLWASRDGDPPVARVLERRLLPPYVAAHGLPVGQLCGLPRLREARFHGSYPLARIDFQDESLPLQARLEAFNPLIPLNDRDSGIPCACFTWTLRNPDPGRTIEATLAFSLLNACGYDGQARFGNRYHTVFGQNLNEYVEQDGIRGIRMSSGKYAPDHPQLGTMAMATPADAVTYKLRWERAGWWDDAQEFWDDFSSDGLLPDDPTPEPSPDGQSDVSTLGVRLTVPAGGAAEARFILSWHFPNLMNYWNDETAVKGKRLGNWYATQWQDAWDVARYVHGDMERLERETHAFHDALFGSTLPEEVLDATSANLSILRTTTVLRTADGRMNAFEGVGDDRGCCPMNCTHVWNYAQTPAYLFPQLERSVRETDFLHNTRPDGNMAFRTLLPLVGELWAFKPAADGQMGTVMKVYREWLQCDDRAFLERMWPGVERALEYAWQPGSWDTDRDGVMEGEQHNTYDIEFLGPNTMCGLFYLGALRAAEEMARAMGDEDKATTYRQVFESGSRKYAEICWNGEYYGQSRESGVVSRKTGADGVPGANSVLTTHDSRLTTEEPRYQYDSGCLADQVLGQWFARVVGLGDLLPQEQVKGALRSIFRYNFRRDLSSHASVQRTYALNEEAGLLLCTWPHGGRPRYPFPYADEVWTGIEYQVAAHMMYEGLVEEGLEIVRAVRERHAGFNRNPWNEFECGHHYARAMSSWSLLLALSGYHYYAERQHLAFDPLLNEQDFHCFFSTGSAWGVYSQRQSSDSFHATLQVLWGELPLRSLRLPTAAGAVGQASLRGASIRLEQRDSGDLALASPLTIPAGEAMDIGFASP